MLDLKAEVESSISKFSFKRLVPGGFNLGFAGSSSTALPWPMREEMALPGMAPDAPAPRAVSTMRDYVIECPVI